MNTKTNIEAVNSGQTEREAFTYHGVCGTCLEKIRDDPLTGTHCRCTQARAAAPQGLTDERILELGFKWGMFASGIQQMQGFARDVFAEQSAAPMAEHGYCQARANNEDCNCASACARWVPAPLPRASEQADEAVTLPYVERFRESHGEGGGVYPDDEGDFMRYSDFVELFAARAKDSK